MPKNYYPEAVKKYKAKAYRQIKVEYKKELVEALEEQLKKDGVSKAEFFRRAIREYLRGKGIDPDSKSTEE